MTPTHDFMQTYRLWVDSNDDHLFEYRSETRRLLSVLQDREPTATEEPAKSEASRPAATDVAPPEFVQRISEVQMRYMEQPIPVSKKCWKPSRMSRTLRIVQRGR